MAVRAPLGNLGWKAPEFELTDTFGAHKTLASLRGPNGLLLMFICNHCPYVRAIIDRICRDAVDIQAMGFGVAAIMSNDTHAYPEDSFAHMQRLAKDLKFTFPYLYDASQEVARAYAAVCTPDFYGFDGELALRYRGRLDSSGIAPAGPDVRRELVEAMRQIAATGQGPAEQISCSGCSIKWRKG